MYQSLFVLGILMFGFFSVTFSNYEEFAENTTLSSNLSHVADEVGSQVADLISRGREMQFSTSNFNVSLDLLLESQYSAKSYILSFDVNANNITRLLVISDGTIFANYTLGFVNGTLNGQINFQGLISSSTANPTIMYMWDSTNLINPAEPAERIIFS